MIARIALCLLVCTAYGANADVDIITEPRPGEEYVLVSSGQQTSVSRFESSHKIPEKHPQHRIVNQEDANDRIIKKLYSGKGKHPSEGIVAIEEDKKASFRKGQKGKISEAIEIDIPVSKLEDIKIKENVKDVETNPKMAVALEAMSESGKLSNRASTTTQKPVLTTTPPATTTKGYEYIPINFDSIDDINTGLLSSNVQLETAGSEQKQHSRIQIKKGPNGQDYEYEYVYYYYDEEDGGKKEGKDSKEKAASSTAAPVHNSHDGPQKHKNSHDGPAKVEVENQITKESKAKSKYSTIDRTGATTAAPDNQNEVLPTASRPRQRGRTVAPAPVEENVEEDRLPSSTRFPPRGRNLAASSSTTYVPEVSSEAVKHRGRQHQPDNVADESIGQTRSRTRAHVRRPSSELVDLDSFKTGDIPQQYKDQPSRYSSESKTTTDVPDAATTVKEPAHTKDTNREGHALLGNIIFQEILDDSKLPADYKQTTPSDQDTTEYTTMTAMEKVALDLYAYLARENLNNEVNEAIDFDGTTTMSDDEGFTTEAMSTTEEATTTTTTSTTTTTPTPAPTTTTTAAPSTRPSRFRGRPGARGRASTTTAVTEAPQETSTKVRGRFGKPGVRKTTTAAVASETSTAAPADKTLTTLTTKQAFGRRGLFAGRTRPSSTTPAPADGNAASETPAPRPRLRPGLRRTTTTTSAAPAEDSTAAGSSVEPAETTSAPTRTIGRGRPGLRPPAASLRPGPRLNLRPNARLRPGQAAAPTEAAPEVSAETPAAEAAATDADSEGSSPTVAPEQPARGGIKLRNRLQVQPSPKPRVAVTAAPRRPNPLLKRKLPSTEATTEAAKKASSETTEESDSEEKSETETEPAAAETTPAPPLRGLDALFARRRAAGIGARPARPARAAGQH